VHGASRPHPAHLWASMDITGCHRIQRRRGNRTLASPKLDCRGRAAPASPSVGGVAANASRAGYVSRASPGCSVLGAGHRARGPGCVAPSDDVWRDQGPGRPEPPYLSGRRLMRHGWGGGSMPRARDFLERFRPGGTPGAVARPGVPADRQAERPAELEPLLALLAETEVEVAQISAGRAARRRPTTAEEQDRAQVGLAAAGRSRTCRPDSER
jgi:hypothetical protein